MSTFQSSRYRSWSNKSFQNDLGRQDVDRPYETQTRMRLHLVTNSRGQMELDLSRRQLLVIPNEVFLFTKLDVLKLGNNTLEEIPLAVSRLRSLKYVYLQNNELTFLPDTLSNCIHLVELNLTCNKLATLPSSIVLLKSLRILRLGQNKFECLPHEIGHLDNLRFLDIHGNNLWYLPFSISKLLRLKYLNLANNKFEHLPLPVCKITCLQVLNLRGNCMVSLLPDFDSLRNVQELNLAYNKFEMIPPVVFKLRFLRYLNVTGNKLLTLPMLITSLRHLQVLHAQGNNIEAIPDSFHSLQYLNIANNRLLNFSVANIKKLRALNANSNLLENIPMGLYSLERIESLRLNGNQIRYVSPDIVMMRRLKTLDLGNNRLTHIPRVIQKMEKLDFFNVKGNNIQEKIALHHGEISPQIDVYQKRRHFQSRRRNMEAQRPRGKSKLPRPRPSSSMPVSHSNPQIKGNGHKMWDSEDLLENGFSERHLWSNSGSAYLHQNQQSDPNFSTLKHSSLPSFSKISAHRTALGSLDSDSLSSEDVPVRTTDYQLLGICNQVEMLLNKQLLHPVLSLKGQHAGKSFSEKAIVKTASGLWRISDDRGNSFPGLVGTTTEVFTVTPKGGWVTSSADENVSIFLPTKAVSKLTQARMKILRVQENRLRELRLENRMISNIVALGPIVYLKANEETDFHHQVTITIPAPPGDKHGHLHLLTIREDNSCIPSSSGYQVKNGYLMLMAWSLAGKAAVLTRAKCKYKACSSMEQLLSALTNHHQ